MDVVNPDKCKRLVTRTSSLVSDMDRTKDIVIHQHINQFFYMQKNEELMLLVKMLSEPEADTVTIASFMESKYREIFFVWRSDIRWLRGYLNNQK